jgi:hypothetical protein
MADEKDRFGSKLRDKERGEEDQYFGERDRALLEKLKQQRAGAAQPVASMRCPKDGTALASIDQHGVTIEECPKCGGLWFDKGEVETIAKRDKDTWLGRLIFGPRK